MISHEAALAKLGAGKTRSRRRKGKRVPTVAWHSVYQPNAITWTASISIRTKNELNSVEVWPVRKRRAEDQRATGFAVGQALIRLGARLPATITLTRVAPSSGLDPHDGLPASLKHVVDGIADAFGLPDRDQGFAWQYGQERGRPREYAVRVEIRRVAG